MQRTLTRDRGWTGLTPAHRRKVTCFSTRFFGSDNGRVSEVISLPPSRGNGLAAGRIHRRELPGRVAIELVERVLHASLSRRGPALDRFTR